MMEEVVCQRSVNLVICGESFMLAKMFCFTWVLVFSFGCSFFSDKPRNSSEHRGKPVVILISVDGYRHDYTDIFEPPHIKEYFSNGVKSDALVSVYPSMTFTNHYAIASGLYTENHGLMANHFWDPTREKEYSMRDRSSVVDGSWYGGTPLWVAASEQGMVSATFFWVGSEADILGTHPDYYFDYDGRISNRERVETAKEWLSMPEKNRPHLITLYFSQVDSQGHRHGPATDEVGQALLELDNDLGELFEFIEKQDFDINVFLVSDHGMMKGPPEKRIALDEFADFSDFKVYASGPMAYFYSPSDDRTQELYRAFKQNEDPERFRVYLREDIPERYHFKNHNAAPDILVDAVMPHVVGPRERLFRLPVGMHGWDPQEPEMKSVFYAKGPQLKSSQSIPEFENIHIYPLIMHILELESPAVDGDLEVLRGILAK